MSSLNKSNPTLRPRQNGRHFADDTFKCIFLNENVRIAIKISLKFVLKGPFNNNSALVKIMAWRRPGDKPLSKPMMVRSLTHICVTRPQWVKHYVIPCHSGISNHAKVTCYTECRCVLLHHAIVKFSTMWQWHVIQCLSDLFGTQLWNAISYHTYKQHLFQSYMSHHP